MLMCWCILDRFEVGAHDFGWCLRAASDLLAGRDPYASPFDSYKIPYPLPAAFFGLPFVSLPPEWAASLFFGLSSGLLAFGLTKDGYTRLFVFLSFPYFSALITAQWSPLLMASAFLPYLLPVVLAKPHVGLPIAVTYVTRTGFWITVAFGLLTLIVMPTWPLRWIGQTGEFQNFIPLLLFPGVVLLSALLNYRDPDARLLLIASILPQRWFYDNFILWLIPRSLMEVLLTTLLSWVVGFWRWFFIAETMDQVGRMSIIFFYLPMLAVVLVRRYKRDSSTLPGIGRM